ncbi:MAG TPA: hypothetical protein VNM48_08160 [Chloroflexota bacterium]|nr:hypothetical protein [Chloroflexota bacterium]
MLVGYHMLGSAAGSHEVKVTDSAMEGPTLPPCGSLSQHSGLEIGNGLEAKRMCSP